MLRTGRRAEAMAQLTKRLAQPGQTPGQTARLRALHAMALNSTGQYDRAEISARQALAEAEQAGDRLAAGYALYALSNVSYYRREPTAQQEHIDRALSLTEMDPQATHLRLLLLASKSCPLSNADRQAEAITAARQALALAERTGAAAVHRARVMLGHLHFDLRRVG